MKKMRIDQLMVKRGLVESREAAQKLILAGKVRIGITPAQKPGQRVSEKEEIHVTESLKYVSRGGYKLERALDVFKIDVSGKTVLDVGASTGGFTDCLLQRGARRVFAVDVGYGQIAWKLRQDPRVVVMDRLNARDLRPELFSEPIDMAAMDVSFISIQKILPALESITDWVIALFKPQFEAGPQLVPRGGVIRDPAVHRKALENFFANLVDWTVENLTESPICGSSGNREFLVLLKRGKPPEDAKEKFYKILGDLFL